MVKPSTVVYCGAMSASVNRPAGPFAQQLGAHASALVSAAGGDASGRWLAARSDRSRCYWASVLAGDVAMNTNDIAILASIFEISPYQLVRDARARDSYALAASDDDDWQARQEAEHN